MAHVIVAAPAFDEGLRFFVDELGFRIETISPADDPARALLSGHGVRVALERDAEVGTIELAIRTADPDLADRSLTGPNGTRVTFELDRSELVIPPLQPSFVLAPMDGGAAWNPGRAGMGYRDLIPDRLGGRFIASHIRIPGAGPVPDYVHHHDIRFQIIACVNGGATLVYEDQGEPFRFEAGDCVLQPPGIRHRVLESFDDLEVVEIGCPASHDTHVDHELVLPTSRVETSRQFGGQRFVRHQGRMAEWTDWRHDGFTTAETEIGAATDGLGGVRTVRSTRRADDETSWRHDAEFVFWFVLDGEARLQIDDPASNHQLGSGDAIVVPAGLDHRVTGCSDDFSFLEVTLPAVIPPG